MFSPNVGELVLYRYVVGADPPLLHHLKDVEETKGYVLCVSTLGPVPDDKGRGSVSIYSRTILKPPSNPISIVVMAVSV